MTRLSKTAAAALFLVTLTLSAPSAMAAQQRDRGGDPGNWPTHIIRIIKQVVHHLIPSSLDDLISVTPPKP